MRLGPSGARAVPGLRNHAGGETLEANLCSGTREIGASETPSFGDGVPVVLTDNPIVAPDARWPSPWSTALAIVAFAGGTGVLAAVLFRLGRQQSAG